MTAVQPTRLEFDPFSEVFFTDPYPTYRRMQEEAPVYRSEQYGGFYALTRYDDVAWALRDSAALSSAWGIELHTVNSGRKPEIPSMILLDPPEHDRLRALVSKVFTPRAISALEPAVREIQRGLLDATRGREVFDVVSDFADWFPMEVISTMLGVPAEKRRWLKQCLDKALTRRPGQTTAAEEDLAPMMEAGAYYYELVGRKRAEPGDDMISRLTQAEVEREDGTRTGLDDLEITGFVGLLGGAGAETVTKAVANAVVLLGQHPEQWALLHEDPGLLPQAVEEVLRYQPPSHYNVRKAVVDVELHGVTIPSGSAVVVLQGAAGRDPRHTPDPERFDITRTPGPMLSLGYGIHSCLGAALARMETRLALELLLERMPRYEVLEQGLRRVTMSNVAGWAQVPVRVRT